MWLGATGARTGPAARRRGTPARGSRAASGNRGMQSHRDRECDPEPAFRARRALDVGRRFAPLRIPQPPLSVRVLHPPLDFPGAVGVRLAQRGPLPLVVPVEILAPALNEVLSATNRPTGSRNERSIRQIRSCPSTVRLSRSGQ